MSKPGNVLEDNTQEGPSPEAAQQGHGFGTLPVFLAGISTILGAVMFLRFGYAVGHVGLIGALAIIALGHLVTIPTALALSEIATNRKVEGGGEYFIISRSFGVRIGAAIGLSLYLSQAISVAFYVIAFAEAFSPLASRYQEWFGLAFDPRVVSVPTLIALSILMLTKGAALGVRTLYVVFGVLSVSLVLFFVGSPVPPADGSLNPTAAITKPDPFLVVFAIVFPSFTGMTAGVGLSGDLAEPRRSIPRGTITATLAGMAIYALIAWKLAVSAPPELLAEDQLVMARIALWGPIIPIGLASATLSSAIGSFLVAPRTLQALARDGCFAPDPVNRLFARGHGDANEPRSATAFTMLVAGGIILLGDIDFVARLISMFFMVTYGALCSISFLEHFAANPDYRPSFRTRWYLSFIGAVTCAVMMVLMDAAFASLSILAMSGFYLLTRFTRAGNDGSSIVAVFLGVMSQTVRWIQLRLQRSSWATEGRAWRPSVVAINPGSLTDGLEAVQLLEWIGYQHGVSTYLQVERGMLDGDSHRKAKRTRERLVELIGDKPSVYVSTMVSPSMRSATAQVLQMPGVSGLENNSVLFTHGPGVDESALQELVENALLASQAEKNVLFLRDDGSRFGRCAHIDVWITQHDEANGKLMLLLAYIIAGHRDWRRAEIRVFAALPPSSVRDERRRFRELCDAGRIPIAERNIRFMAASSVEEYERCVSKHSADADLLITGLTATSLGEDGPGRLSRHGDRPHVLFVLAQQDLELD